LLDDKFIISLTRNANSGNLNLWHSLCSPQPGTGAVVAIEELTRELNDL
jgi:hypothetical protein